MRGLAAILTAAALFFGAAGESQAGFSPVSAFSGFPSIQIVATVSLSEQQMFLEVRDGKRTKTALIWKVSTGRKGLDTPMGAYKPTWLDIDHKSDQYEDAPMPYAVFFSGGYAIHATEFVKRLGTPASHGCVRLSPENAETFFNLVKTYGRANTRIVITD
jgi:lipoprotein-anchoring transpeptidase ErfK/SrfK